MPNLVFGADLNSLDADLYFMGRRPDANVTMVAVQVLAHAPDREQMTHELNLVSGMMPRFRQRLRPSLFGDLLPPTWVPVEDFDVTDHIHRRALPEGGGFDEMMTVVDEIMNEPWDMSRPLWSVTVLTGLDGDRAASLIKVHHCMSDGSALVMVLGAKGVLEAMASADAPIGAVVAEGASTRARATLRTAIAVGASAFPEIGRHLLALRDRDARGRFVSALREVFRRGDYTRRPGSARRACVFEVPADRWKAVAAERGGGANDLLLASGAAIWRRYYARERGDAGVVRLAMAVSPRTGAGDDDGGNTYRLASVPVGLGEGLAPIRDSVTRVRAEALTQGRGLADSLPQLLPGPVRGRIALRRSGWNDVGSTNLSAPFDCEVSGVPVEGMFNLSCPNGQPFALGLMRYRDRVHVAVNADLGFVDRWEDLVKAVQATLEDFGLEAVVHRGRTPRPDVVSDARPEFR